MKKGIPQTQFEMVIESLCVITSLEYFRVSDVRKLTDVTTVLSSLAVFRFYLLQFQGRNLFCLHYCVTGMFTPMALKHSYHFDNWLRERKKNLYRKRPIVKGWPFKWK